MSEPGGKTREEPHGFLSIAHRGASAYAPENTMAAIDEAIARNADMVEFDLRRTSDGVIVLFHDRFTSTLSGGRKLVSKVSHDGLQKIAKYNGYTLATFEEVLSKYGSLIPMDIEVKVEGFESELIRLLRKYPPKYRPIISSFSYRILRNIQAIDKSFTTAWIIGNDKFRWLNILYRLIVKMRVTGRGVRMVHIHDEIATESILKRLSRHGVSIFVWTVDDPDRMRELLNSGIQGIVTNKPDILAAVCGDKEIPTVAEPEYADRHVGPISQQSRLS